MRKLEGLKPEKVFRYFEDISAIPRGSGNEEAVSQYCLDFARDHGLAAYRDENNNVVITKEAAKGYENVPGMILQGHLDMVCEKDEDCTIDFTRDGIDLVVDGDLIRANGTTLGGDDGVAVAIMLAILDDDTIEHPHLECVFTTEEETGLYGAEALDCSRLKGRRMINIDSRREGVFTVSCAGGVGCGCILPLEWEETEGSCYTVWVDGLKGGHSGSDIDKELGNSNILMGRLLCVLDETVELQLGETEGGMADNAIPHSTHAVLYVPEGEEERLKEELRRMDAVYKKEFAASDPGVTVHCEKHGRQAGKVLTPRSKALFLFLLHHVPNGVIRNSMDIRGLVQTSLNLGILKMDEKEAVLVFGVRSSLESEKEELGKRLRHLTEFLGGTCVLEGDYPGWEYLQESPLRESMVSIYERMYGQKPQVLAIHAGLECGFFCGKIEGLDCVSIGPNQYDLHTPRERLSISSTKRVYDFILEVLKEQKEA